jgi:hypothetical protein
MGYIPLPLLLAYLRSSSPHHIILPPDILHLHLFFPISLAKWSSATCITKRVLALQLTPIIIFLNYFVMIHAMIAGMEIQLQWLANHASMIVYRARMHRPVRHAATPMISECLRVWGVSLLQATLMTAQILLWLVLVLHHVQLAKTQEHIAYHA